MNKQRSILHSSVMAAAAFGLSMSPIFASSLEKHMKDTIEKSQTAIYDILDKDITTVSFEAGSSEVSDNEKRDLRALIKSVRDDTKIKSIIVAAWADKEYPDKKGERLSDADRQLADKRAASVEKVLTEMGAKGVETFSMAEHPSWISKAFSTTEANVKKSMEKEHKSNQKSTTQQLEKITSTLKDKGGPSTVVVVVNRMAGYESASTH